jgi:flagellar protein FliL
MPEDDHDKAAKGSPKKRRQPGGKEEQPTKKKYWGLSKKQLIGCGAGAALLIVVIVAVLIIRFVGSPAGENGSAKDNPEITYIEDPEGVLSGATMPLKPFVVNLLSEGTFLLLGMTLEFFDLELPPYVEQRIPSIRDAIIKVVSAKRPDELLTLKGKEQLRRELVTAINKILDPENPVANIYFTRFTVQSEKIADADRG